MCPGSQGIPGTECKGCGAERPVEGRRGSEGRASARGALCLALTHHHRQHRPQGSHKGHLFLTDRGASMVGSWGGSSSWLAHGHLLPGFCYSRETVLVSSLSEGTDPILRISPPLRSIDLGDTNRRSMTVIRSLRDSGRWEG